MNWDENVLLVTGAAGWLGRRLVDVLANGLPGVAPFDQVPSSRRLRCLVQHQSEADSLRKLSDRVEVVVGDLTDPRASSDLCRDAKSSTLFHTAGVIHPRRVREFYDVNVGGTEKLLAAAIEAGVRRAVVVSSNSPIGVNPAPDHLFDEQSPYHPYMGYGRSKMLMELSVKALQQRGDIETVLVRPPWFYGPYQPPRQTLFFEMIRDGKGPVVGGGENLRSMAYIDNLCQGLLLCAATERANGEIYWIADDAPYTMNQVLDTVERLMEGEFKFKVAHKRLRLPGVASQVAYVCDWVLQRLGLYQQKIHVLSEMNKTIACSVAKAKAELGYEPRVQLEEGMRRSLSWCIEAGLLKP